MYWRWPATTVSWLPVLLVTSAIGCAGRSGDADTKPAPAPATTNDKPTDHEDHDLRLEY
jgi:hypothetical protein